MEETLVYKPIITVIPATIKKAAVIEKQLRVAAYCRVSTDDEEQQSSYKSQIDYYTDKILRNNSWRLVEIFADEGLSGTGTKKRPEFLRMISMCRKKKIDLILTKSISRFARNTVDCLNNVRELRALGIYVIFEKENINTSETDMGELLLTLMSCFAQAESESISKNVSWGIRQSFKNGKVPIRYSHLLGYERGENDKPRIIPEQAETVRFIFNRYLDGLSLKNIADELTIENHKNISGAVEWSATAIKRIIENEKYCGCALLQKTYILDCITKKSKKNNGELPMYFISNNHEPIVSKETFDRAQEETAKRVSKKKNGTKFGKDVQGKYSAKYALSELLICAECGTAYSRVTWTAKGYKEYNWRCSSRLQNGKKYCKHSPTIEESALHTAIVTAINKFTAVKDEVSDMLEQNIRQVLIPNFSETIINAEKRIKEIQQLTMELVSPCVASGDAEKYTEEFERFKNETDGLREFIKLEKSKAEIIESDTSKVDYIIETLRSTDFEVKDYDDIIVRHLVEGIKVVSKEKILVVFKGGFEMEQEIDKG